MNLMHILGIGNIKTMSKFMQSFNLDPENLRFPDK